MNNIVSASILSADLLDLRGEIKRMEESGVEWLHFDVMDGVFVPNISYGIPVLAQVSRAVSHDTVLDVHLMITDPIKYIGAFSDAGADFITFHLESKSNADATIAEIKAHGARCGISIKPATPAEAVFPYIGKVDMVLVMTVEPGFGGQKFMDMSEKIAAIRKYADENRRPDLLIEVDGGIDEKTAPVVKNAGANVLVSGSYLFRAENMTEAAEKLRK